MGRRLAKKLGERVKKITARVRRDFCSNSRSTESSIRIHEDATGKISFIPPPQWVRLLSKPRFTWTRNRKADALFKDAVFHFSSPTAMESFWRSREKHFECRYYVWTKAARGSSPSSPHSSFSQSSTGGDTLLKQLNMVQQIMHPSKEAIRKISLMLDLKKCRCDKERPCAEEKHASMLKRDADAFGKSFRSACYAFRIQWYKMKRFDIRLLGDAFDDPEFAKPCVEGLRQTLSEVLEDIYAAGGERLYSTITNESVDKEMVFLPGRSANSALLRFIRTT